MRCRWWTRAEANSDSWHTSSRALPSDSSFRRDLACLLEEPPNWQRAQVTPELPYQPHAGLAAHVSTVPGFLNSSLLADLLVHFISSSSERSHVSGLV